MMTEDEKESPDPSSESPSKKPKLTNASAHELPRIATRSLWTAAAAVCDYSRTSSETFWTDHMVRGGSVPAPFPASFIAHRTEIFKARIRTLDRMHAHPSDFKPRSRAASDSLEKTAGPAFKLSLTCSSSMHMYRFGELIGSQKLRRLSRLQTVPHSNGTGLALCNICAPATKSESEHPSSGLPTRLHSVLFVPRKFHSTFFNRTGSTPPDHPVNHCDLLISTETQQNNNRILRFASAATGKEILKIWIASTSHFFGDLAFHREPDSLCVKSSLFSYRSPNAAPTLEGSPHPEKRIIVMYWDLFPLRYTGGFVVSDTVFGKGLTGVGDFEDTLAVCYKANSKEFLELFDLKPFLKNAQNVSIIYGDKWNELNYSQSTSGDIKTGCYPMLSENLRGYGLFGCGMPLTFGFEDKPPVLLRIYTSLHFLCLSMHLHHFLVADKTLNEFYFINASTGQRVDGPVLHGDSYCDSPALELSSLLLFDAKGERLALWNGMRLVIYVIRRSGPEKKLVLEEDRYVYPPDTVEIQGDTIHQVCLVPAKHSDAVVVLPKQSGNWACDLVSYCYDLDILMVMFQKDLTERKGARCLLTLLEGSSGDLLTVVNLCAHRLHQTDHKSEVELDEYGLSHYYADNGGSHTLDVYTFRELGDDENQCCVYKVFIPPSSAAAKQNRSSLEVGKWVANNL
ncbi:uncharacterized protein LOC129593803 isoform X2 [Paramacrobiotus metropolitanus]|uniref:uncharacterized protein LOC129593803 isoform X2 n=1 Tax=Paramacrobiotus metropolitanus TaxID=2943436 RepID=UPI002445B29B|nr:uncharacterized protein LOC129593803 isoform X2 [Paramacrobiotus metropolitanus]